jgi:hypothetical protein
MSFEKGKPKTGGRKAGTLNRTTADLKGRINTLLQSQFDTVVRDLEQLEPKDRVSAYLKLLEYAVPKLNRTEQVSTDRGTKCIRRDEDDGSIIIQTVYDEDGD